MPSVIPYDPSLVLGNIVHPQKLQQLEEISEIMAPADRAEDELNSFITLRRSIDMTIQELANLNVSTGSLITERTEVNKEIEASAVNYAKLKIDAKKKIQQIKTTGIINADWESPIDYNRTEIKQMPLSSDSMNMNVQYFSFDSNTQSSKTQAQHVQGFISSEFSFLGNNFSENASKAVQSQVSSQYSRHDIQGTLVIAVSCTHKNAALLAPCIIDVDKAVRVWNAMYRDDMIKTDDFVSLSSIAAEAQTKKENTMTILSGATYGSCFVGMVHILNNSTTISTEKVHSIAESIQAQFKANKWFQNASGGFGVSKSFSDSVKNMLSIQSISSHCTLTTRGSIPSIKSNAVKIAVQGFTQFDGKSSMDSLAALQNSTATSKDSIDSSAESARTGQQMIAMQNAKIQGVLSELSEIDAHSNNILDINSLMTAFEDYVDKALNGELGVPINFYVKPIPKSEIAQMWIDKYFEKQFLKVTSNDG